MRNCLVRFSLLGIQVHKCLGHPPGTVTPQPADHHTGHIMDSYTTLSREGSAYSTPSAPSAMAGSLYSGASTWVGTDTPSGEWYPWGTPFEGGGDSEDVEAMDPP
eukprot:m.462107 g.462107  ORF g.462107 m.462107 type:complete len:105 (+) comp22525_c0_seq1:46-360(+)